MLVSLFSPSLVFTDGSTLLTDGREGFEFKGDFDSFKKCVIVAYAAMDTALTVSGSLSPLGEKDGDLLTLN